MNRKVPRYSFILAAGKGTRMRSDTCPKVCFKVNGVPAVCRAMEIYSRCGIFQHVVVTGTLAEKVMETVSDRFPNTVYVYQKEQKGTADAIRSALRALPSLEPDADILIAAGDRIIEKSVLEELFDLYYSSGAVLAFPALRCGSGSSQGRIVMDGEGNPSEIIECADIRERRVRREIREAALSGRSMGAEELRSTVQEFFFRGGVLHPDKAEKAFPDLWGKIAESRGVFPPETLLAFAPEEKTVFRTARGILSPDEAESITSGNTSVYLVRCGILREAVEHLSSDNAQKEEYLSDLPGRVRQMHPEAAVRVLPVEDRSRILGFNDPSELLEAERLLYEKEKVSEPAEPDPALFLPLSAWHELLSGAKLSEFRKTLEKLYGPDPEIRSRQLNLMRNLLKKAEKEFPPEKKMMLVRSPGRLNVMGRHVDHQGGNCNLMTIGFETLFFAAPREDDVIALFHCDEAQFGSRRFSIRQLVRDLPWEDWHSVVSSAKLGSMIREYGVDWSNYIQAAVLRLQKQFPTRPLRGMDMVVSGNVPMAAGLSSSSSLLVGAADACAAVNRLEIAPSRFVSLCGEGEWFVGTRGGSADHAAVKMGQKGSVVKVRFFDFAVEETVPFPDGYTMIVCDSGVKARKSSDAKDLFNHRISCYRIGLCMIRKFFPQFAPSLEHLRDVCVRKLHVPLKQIYRILLSLPENATMDELKKMLPDADPEALCAPHNPPPDGKYPVRGVVLFGLAEMQRSARYAELLKKGDMKAIGQMMNVSHNGDRVVTFDREMNETPYHAPSDDGYLRDRIEDLESGEVDRVIRSQLDLQPGGYACSIPAIDRMVELALRTPGVLGAQLAGAGLGGCMMILAESRAVEEVRKNLREGYYRPSGHEEIILCCSPVAGAGGVRNGEL